jgi:RsmE family RNA methyltransferase
MQRFFSKIPTPELLQIRLSEQPELYHQVTRVLRMQVGDTGIFFEENGDDLVYEIASIDKKSIVWNRIEVRPRMPEILPNIILCQSLPNKLEKLEFILQKGVEVGVDQFVFFDIF